jgi:phage/plasmid primase-like uncharacterized protein
LSHPLLARRGLDLVTMAARWRLPEDSPRLRRLATALGLSPPSLHRLAAGWSPDHRAWVFPMTDAAGQVVGIRLRGDNGRKWAVPGSREGLFVPSGPTPGGRLLVTEGPTDCAALLELKFPAVGRPSCSGGVRHVVRLVKRLAPAEAVIVADYDPPDARGRRAGLTGAERLAATLVAYVRVVKVIIPPHGLKDARAWLQAGATAADVLAAIGTAPVRRLAVSTQRKGTQRCGTKAIAG